MIAALLARSGVSQVVLSPGSRDVPLIMALERYPDIATHVVIDERSAGFIALGMAVASGNPVALVCTSGTAPLNYGPALAEAFYQHIPLIAITADRPAEWIDQADSQTIIQPGIFANYTKGTFDIPAESDDSDRMWHINRMINDAINTAVADEPGPVHINVHLTDPLGEEIEVDCDIEMDDFRYIERPFVPVNAGMLFEELGELMEPPAKVLVVVGYMKPHNGLEPMLRELSRRPNIVVMQEAQSCINGHGEFITNIDATLRCAGDDTSLDPDIIITLGGAITSAALKSKLRKLPPQTEHWIIAQSTKAVDTFRHASRIIPCPEWNFLNEICSFIKKRKPGNATGYKTGWFQASKRAHTATVKASKTVEWSDFRAMGCIMRNFPRKAWMHIGNGMAVRYLQYLDYGKAFNVTCNRGVSGIDGSTSTAIGVASANGAEMPTVLITGDMSMQYDIGALATSPMPENLKIVVLNNGGGGIFRFIKTTRSLDELDKCLACKLNLPLADIAPAFGFRYMAAANEKELAAAMRKLASVSSGPVILEVITDGSVSAQVFTEFIKTKLTIQ